MARLVKGAGVVKVSQNGSFWINAAKLGLWPSTTRDLEKTLSKKYSLIFELA